MGIHVKIKLKLHAIRIVFTAGKAHVLERAAFAINIRVAVSRGMFGHERSSILASAYGDG
jgi:hypothetical protein